MAGKRGVLLCTERTLYDCVHARVHGKRIYCDRGHYLSEVSCDGNLCIGQLESGMALALPVCQRCGDFEAMGDPVPEEERGWLKQKLLR